VTDPNGNESPFPRREVTVNSLVAYNVARFRNALGMTQRQLGELLGWSEASVSAAERSWEGRRVREFDADEIVRIAGVFAIPVIALLLPPEDSGTKVDYTFQAGDDQVDTDGLLSRILTDFQGDTPSMTALRDRLARLGASSHYLDLQQAEAERAELAAGAMHAAAQATEAEEILRNARAEADEIVADARTHARHLADNEQVDGLIADARQAADEVLGRARREADDILTKARRESERITSNSRGRAESLERLAQERWHEVMGSLVQSREELERRVDDLRMFEREYRRRLLAYLEGQVRDLKAGAADDDAIPLFSGRTAELRADAEDHP
jgi:transcriptional regulator with XRE-family HTH domain